MEETLSSHNPYLLLATQSPEVSYLSGQQEPDSLENAAVFKDTTKRGCDEYLATSENVPGENMCVDSWCNKGGKVWDKSFLTEDYHCKAANVLYSDEESYYSQSSCQSSTPFFTEVTRQNKALHRSPGFNPNNSPMDSRGWIDPVCYPGQGDPALWFGLTQSRDNQWQEPITQKLDSFSEAFLSQRRGKLTLHPGANSSRHHRRVGKAETRTSCVLDSSSSPSPTLPSPPAHLTSYVLSPPPTPLTPPSLSPPNMGSPGTVAGAPSQAVDTLWFFPSHRPLLTRSSGRSWKEQIFDHGSSSYSPSDIHQSENQLFFSSSVHPSRLLPAPQSDQTGINSPQESGCRQVKLLQSQEPDFNVTGVPFASILHSRETTPRDHFTPRPLLNPARRGAGLFSSISPQRGEDKSVGREENVRDRSLVRVNVGDEFQAKLPPCLKNGVARSQDKELSREELLWKPQLDLEENAAFQDHVEKLLLMCSSSCLPGGGSNTELALHCLHCCNGDVMMTLEMLMFTLPSPTGNYHYSGSDVWTEVEKKSFSSALKMYGKDFSLIHKTVKSKSVSQCVEFYYLTVKAQQKRQKVQKESRRPGDAASMIKNGSSIGQLANTTFEVAPAPPLASFFPCKLCGKMFYKIKSRNAHMKIHRQPQEDWTDLRTQHHQLASSLLLQHSSMSSAPMTFLPPGYMPYPAAELSGARFLNSEPGGSINTPIQSANVSHPKNRELVLHQAWNSEGLEPMSFYCSSEGRDAQGAVADEPISWL